MPGPLARALGVLALLTVAAGAPAAQARPALPRDFFGIVPQGALEQSDYDRMRGVVRTLRIPIFWHQVEPSPGEYRFAETDQTVIDAAAAGVRVMPFVYGSPAWLSGSSAVPPLATAPARRAWALFLRELVDRYGPHGELWQVAGRDLPIRRWQIWNEPNFVLFWRPRPQPVAYARLLRISARAIRAEDRGARIVTAGVAPVEAGIAPWTFLRKLYRVPGVSRDFELVGLHPYATRVRWVGDIVRYAREAMVDAGDRRTPLLLTEIGIASSGRYPNAFDKGLHGQAFFLRRALGLLVAKAGAWRIAGVDWFTWRDGPAPDPHCVFCEYGGLFDADGAPKPAWHAFRRIAFGARAAPVR